jgi:hypothetical protein
MTILSRARHHALVFTLAAVSASCAAPTPADPLEGNRVDGFPSTLSVVNDGPVVLTDVRVLTSEKDSVVIATLQPGETKGPYGISVMHESPLVRMTARGRVMLLHPVEGFSGFNPARPAGAYTVKLRPGSDPNQIDLRISP